VLRGVGFHLGQQADIVGVQAVEVLGLLKMQDGVGSCFHAMDFKVSRGEFQARGILDLRFLIFDLKKSALAILQIENQKSQI
jgi:hypothetical protein